MSDATQPDGQRAAAEYLRQLLLKPGRYRDAWQNRVERRRSDAINQLAVAEVIAGQLRSEPHHAGDGQVMPYQLGEIVSGALSGERLGEHTLELFVVAFALADHEAERLRRLRAGSARISVLSGSHAISSQAERDVDHALGPRRHQTISLHDHVWVGADRRIDRVRTLHVIEATGPGLDRVTVLCDTNVLTIDVGHGCKQLTGEVRRIGDDLFATDIILNRSLELGDTSTLEYWTTFRYPGDPCDPAEREFRRAGMRQIQNFDIRVAFHPEQVPARVWWARWDGIEGDVLDEEPATLDNQHSVHRYLRSLDKSVTGFYWRWD